MSMTVDGTWKAGVWASTVWANGVWFEGTPTPPAPPSQNSGGYEYALRAPRRRTPEEIRLDRKRHGIITRQAQSVIDAVAARQAESLRQDEQQRLEELSGELKLAGIEWETRYLNAMNSIRARLIDEEIGSRLRAKAIQDQNQQTIVAMLLLIS